MPHHLNVSAYHAERARSTCLLGEADSWSTWGAGANAGAAIEVVYAGDLDWAALCNADPCLTRAVTAIGVSGAVLVEELAPRAPFVDLVVAIVVDSVADFWAATTAAFVDFAVAIVVLEVTALFLRHTSVRLSTCDIYDDLDLAWVWCLLDLLARTSVEVDKARKSVERKAVCRALRNRVSV